MPPDHRRSERVAAAIREEVAGALAAGVKDPRISRLTTVTGVEITRDLRHATVFVSVMGDDSARAATLEGLASLGHGLRGRIGRALQLRVAPELHWKYDESLQRAARIEALLAGIKGETAARDASPDAAAPGTTARGDDGDLDVPDLDGDESVDDDADDARGAGDARA